MIHRICVYKKAVLVQPDSSNIIDGTAKPVVFNTTRWSVVLTAGDPTDPGSFEALTHLCHTYWFPLYAYVRRRGHSPHDAQDLTQSFFTTFLEKERFSRADRARGRFRTFLLTSMKYFLSDEYDRRASKKRGGDREIISIDEAVAESRYLAEPNSESSPDHLFEKRWAITLLNQVIEQLREEFSQSGKADIFDELKAYLWGDQVDTPIKDIAKHLQMTEGATKVTMHRLRKRYKERLRQTIADTVDSPDDIDDELRYLATILRS